MMFRLLQIGFVLVAMLGGCLGPLEPQVSNGREREACIGVLAQDESGFPRDVVLELPSGRGMSWVAWSWPVGLRETWQRSDGFGFIEVLPLVNGNDEVQALAGVVLLESNGLLGLAGYSVKSRSHQMVAGEIQAVGAGLAHHYLGFSPIEGDTGPLRVALGASTSNEGVSVLLHLMDPSEQVVPPSPEDTARRRLELQSSSQHDCLPILAFGNGPEPSFLEATWTPSAAPRISWFPADAVSIQGGPTAVGPTHDVFIQMEIHQQLEGGFALALAQHVVDSGVLSEIRMQGVLFDYRWAASSETGSCMQATCLPPEMFTAFYLQAGAGPIEIAWFDHSQGIISSHHDLVWRSLAVPIDSMAAYGLPVNELAFADFQGKLPI